MSASACKSCDDGDHCPAHPPMTRLHVGPEVVANGWACPCCTGLTRVDEDGLCASCGATAHLVYSQPAPSPVSPEGGMAKDPSTAGWQGIHDGPKPSPSPGDAVAVRDALVDVLTEAQEESGACTPIEDYADALLTSFDARIK